MDPNQAGDPRATGDPRALEKFPAFGDLRAACVLLVGLVALLLAPPGLDGVSPRWLADPDDRAEARASRFGFALLVASDLNRWVVHPISARLAPLQRPLRIAQSWSLYGLGPNRVWRAEIYVDGVRVYRSGADDARWQWPLLRFRRVRPVVVNTCRGASPVAPALVSLLARRAARDFPGAASIAFVCTTAAWPGDGPTREVARWEAHAPDWTPRIEPPP